ncbi:MAG: hypothetical protein KAG20_05675 [Cocleimonas sp.]|nr:hypothetical protein [Cocleimonas sp.]
MTAENYTIAIIVRNNMLYAWQHSVLKRLLALKNINVSLLLSTTTSVAKHPLALRFIHHIERYLYNCQPHLFTERPVDDLLKEVKQQQSLGVRGLDLSAVDFVINFSEEILPDVLLKQPKRGVWSIFIGDTETVNSQLTAMNDFLSEDDVVTIGLQLETLADEVNIILYKSQVGIDMASLCRTAEQCLHKITHFIPYYLEQMQYKKKTTVLEFSQPNAPKNSISIIESASLIWQKNNGH